MADQSDSHQGGSQRRLAKSAKGTRSPIRTRSRSRILAQRESLPSDSSSAAAGVKRSLQESEDPAQHSKKLKTKQKADTPYTVSNIEHSEVPSHFANIEAEGAKSASKPNARLPKITKSGLHLDSKSASGFQDVQKVSKKSDHSLPLDGSSSHGHLASASLVSAEERHISLVLDSDLYSSSYLHSGKIPPLPSYTRNNQALDPGASDFVAASTSASADRVKKRKSNFARDNSSKDVNEKNRHKLSGKQETAHSLSQANLLPQQVTGQGKHKNFSSILRGSCKRKDIVESHLSHCDKQTPKTVEKEINPFTLKKDNQSSSFVPKIETQLLTKEEIQIERSSASHSVEKDSLRERTKKNRSESSAYPSASGTKSSDSSTRSKFVLDVKDQEKTSSKSKTTGSCTSSRNSRKQMK